MPFLQNLSPVSGRLKTLHRCLHGVLLGIGLIGAVAHAEPQPEPSVDTPPQVVFEVVLAEIALKRDKPQVALAAYADLVLKYNDPGIFRRAMEVAAMNRHPELMLETARLWVEKEPNSTDALNALSGTLILLGRYADAQPVLARYLALLPPDQRGKALLQLPSRFPPSADPQRARKLVDLVTEPYLSTPEALLTRAQFALRAGDDAAVLKNVQQARRLQPDSEAALLLNAQILAKQSPDAVLPLFAQFLSNYPNAAAVRALYAQQLLNAGRTAEARVEVARVLDQSDVAPEPLFAAAAVAVQAQAPDLAITALNRLLRVETIDTALIEYNLGLAYESRADLERTQPGSQTATAHSETEAILHYQLVSRGEYLVPARLRAANLMVRRGNMSGARALLQSTTAESPSARAELVIGEATLLREAGDPAAAFKLIERAVAKDPSNVTLRYEMGMMAEKLGKQDLFERSMREVIRRDPNYAQAYNALGFTFADRNVRLKEARTLIEKALSLAPNDPFILDSMGWVNYREQKYDAALDYLNRAAALRTDPEIIAHQVEVLRVMGRGDDALTLWRAGTARFPTSPELKAVGKTLPGAASAVPPASPGGR
jgi:tetratricopeptide (TPR) repeat protein